MCVNWILEIEAAPKAKCDAANNQSCECKPQTCADVLATQPPKQRNQRPATQDKEKYADQNAHTRSVA